MYFQLFLLIVLNFCFSSIAKLSKFSIIGGQTAKLEQFPYIVSIEFYKEHWCAGSIISSDLILTAAHCIHSQDNFNVNDIQIRVGTNQRENGGQLYNVSKIIEHPLYNKSGVMEYDIAIYKLEKSIKFDRNHVNKIKLVKSGFRLLKKLSAITSGWGADNPNSTDILPDTLRYVQIRTFTYEECFKFYDVANIEISNTTFCGGQLDGKKDSCQGDSGGPLVIGHGKRQRQLGIVSAGAECGVKNIPGLYTNVALLRNWIDETIKNL